MPEGHPDRMNNFADWLRYYNLLDVVPLAAAIDHAFENYFCVFGMDPCVKMSLAGYANLVQMKCFNPEAPFVHSFSGATTAVKHDPKSSVESEYTEDMFEDSDDETVDGEDVVMKDVSKEPTQRKEKFKELRELFRNSLFGGLGMSFIITIFKFKLFLVNVYHRMTDLTGQTGLPRSTTIAPNGDKFTKIVFFDFNALYLWAQSQEFPTTPGSFR